MYVHGQSSSAIRTSRAQAIFEDIRTADKELAKAWAIRAIKQEIVTQAKRQRLLQKLERERAAIAKATREKEARCAEESAGMTLRWAAEYDQKLVSVDIDATGDIDLIVAEARGSVGTHARERKAVTA